MKLTSRLLILCVAIAIVACSKKSAPDPNSVLIVGKWRVASYSVKIYHDGVLTFILDNAMVAVPESEEFNSDGTGKIIYPNDVPGPGSFTYGVAGNILTVNTLNQVVGQQTQPPSSTKSTIIELSATELSLFSEYSETVDGTIIKTTTSIGLVK